MKSFFSSACLCVFLLLAAASTAPGSSVEVHLIDGPTSGIVALYLFDSPESFTDLRTPYRSVRFDLSEEPTLRIEGVPPGVYALLVYLDENANGRLDRNFIGIPTEPIGFSNQYVPRGPPTFPRAAFTLTNETARFDVELQRPLGDRGRIAAGVGVLGRSSPYVDSSTQVVRFIPAVYYLGNRIQIFGPAAQLGIVSGDALSLALRAQYQPGVYKEKDSPILEGLGNRRDTMLLGLASGWSAPNRFELSASYSHDVLDRVGGGLGQLSLSRTIPAGPVRITPSIGLNWLSAEMGNDFFGVPASRATPTRPAYRLSDTWNGTAGLNLFIEVTPNWQAILGIGAERLNSQITRSPIVADDWVWNGFFSLGRVF